MEDVKVNVMMFGGKRSGKTSIIAAMQDCFKKIENQLSLSLSASNETAPIIEEKQEEIKTTFHQIEFGRTFSEDTTDYTGTDDIREYNLHVKLKKLDKKNKTTIDLNFIDYPGEFIKNRRGDLAELMEKSRIIMIAIDTPFLMEKPQSSNNGICKYNEKRNFCAAIENMLKESFGDLTKETFPIMIMFVPLKCEKYYNAGQMDLVNEKIHTAYKNVFDFVSGDYRSIFEVVITPILTFGPNGIQFSRFETDENGEIIENASGLPDNPIYRFTAPKKEENKHNPKHCEQPILYSLAYLLSVAEKAKKKESWFVSFFTEVFGGAASLEDFMEKKKEIIATLKTSGEGFEVFSDPLKFNE